jgi:hypothetical protein
MNLPQYTAEEYTYELNDYPWYSLGIQESTLVDSRHDGLCHGIFKYKDEEVCKHINISLEDYQQYCVKKFNGQIINKKLLFEYEWNLKSAIQWVNKKLEPKNVINKLAST